MAGERAGEDEGERAAARAGEGERAQRAQGDPTASNLRRGSMAAGGHGV